MNFSKDFKAAKETNIWQVEVDIKNVGQSCQVSGFAYQYYLVKTLFI